MKFFLVENVSNIDTRNINIPFNDYLNKRVNIINIIN